MIRSGYGRSSTSRSFRVSSAHIDAGNRCSSRPRPWSAMSCSWSSSRLAELLRSREERLTDIAIVPDRLGRQARRGPPSPCSSFAPAAGRMLRRCRRRRRRTRAHPLRQPAARRHHRRQSGAPRARRRRAASTASPETLVTGDFLFSRAFQICGRFDERLIHLGRRGLHRAHRGRDHAGPLPSQRGGHVRRLPRDHRSRKTASLFEVGARARRLPRRLPTMRVVEAMARCGRHVGLTFQMIDDLLDVTGAEATLGKPIGGDAREGNPFVADRPRPARGSTKCGAVSPPPTSATRGQHAPGTAAAHRSHRARPPPGARARRHGARSVVHVARFRLPPVPADAHRSASSSASPRHRPSGSGGGRLAPPRRRSRRSALKRRASRAERAGRPPRQCSDLCSHMRTKLHRRPPTPEPHMHGGACHDHARQTSDIAPADRHTAPAPCGADWRLKAAARRGSSPCDRRDAARP